MNVRASIEPAPPASADTWPTTTGANNPPHKSSWIPTGLHHVPYDGRRLANVSASRLSVVSSASRYRTPWTVRPDASAHHVCRLFLSSGFLPALRLPWPFFWATHLQKLSVFIYQKKRSRFRGGDRKSTV